MHECPEGWRPASQYETCRRVRRYVPARRNGDLVYGGMDTDDLEAARQHANLEAARFPDTGTPDVWDMTTQEIVWTGDPVHYWNWRIIELGQQIAGLEAQQRDAIQQLAAVQRGSEQA